MRRFQEKSPKHLLNKKETGPNMDSFSLCERREAAKIRNQEMCDVAISIIGEYVDKHLNPSDLDSKRLNDDLENLSLARWSQFVITSCFSSVVS